MPANSSCVPRLMLRNSGISPIPSGSKRQTSSVMPGRMVGFTMPTTPRQLENDIVASPAFLFPFVRNIALGGIARACRGVAPGWIAVAAAARALRDEFVAGLQFEARRGLGLNFLIGVGPHHKAGRGAGLAACEAGRRKLDLVEAADDGGVFQQFVLAPQRQPAAPLAGAAG